MAHTQAVRFASRPAEAEFLTLTEGASPRNRPAKLPGR
jgi:hypothetical protein